MILEPDQFYYVDGRYVWTPERRAAAWEDCFRRLDEAIQTRTLRKIIVLVGVPGAGKSTYARKNDAADIVVFDGFFGLPERRARVLQIARAAGLSVEAVWVETSWEECVARNARRSPDRQVPVEAMREMYNTLAAHPPSVAEGFAAVRRV